MPHYKNKEDFVQPITLSGKRYIVKPGEIIFSDRELDLKIYSFLEKTAENKTANLIALKSNKQEKNKDIENLKSVFNNSIKDIHEKIEKLVSREQLIGAVNTVLKETPQIEQEELETMASEISTLKETLESLSNNSIILQLKDDIDKIKKDNIDIFRRLDILKKVLQNLENVIYESEDYVINEDEKGE